MADNASTSPATSSRPTPATPSLIGDGASVTRFAPCATWVLRIAPDTASDVASVAGFELKGKLNTTTASAGTNGREAYRIGPDEWWLMAATDDKADVARALGTGLGNRVHSLVDVSDRQVTFRIDGPASRNLLATGMPLDLHDSVFPAGSCTRTLFAKAEIVIARPAVAPSFDITVNRSFADYLFGLWKDAIPMIRPPGQTSHRDGTATLGHSLRSASSS